MQRISPINLLNLSAKLNTRYFAPRPNYIRPEVQSRLSLAVKLFSTTAKTEIPNFKKKPKARVWEKAEKRRGAMSNIRSPSTPVPLTWEQVQSMIQSQVSSSTLYSSPSPPDHGGNANKIKGPRVPVVKEKRDTIISPSIESGGVPEPSPEYLAYASHPPFILPSPRIIFIIIDLNGTLLLRPSKYQPTKFVLRPYAREFLSYCIRTFRVAIWSSARMGNISPMLDQLLSPELRGQLVAIRGREHFGLSESDFKKRVMCYKRLTWLWNDKQIQSTHPDAGLGKRWDQTNTLLIDDSSEKARSEPYNLVQIPEFMGDPHEEGYILPQIHDYINECSRQVNISSYIRQSPFMMQYGFQLAPPQTR